MVDKLPPFEYPSQYIFVTTTESVLAIVHCQQRKA